MRARLARLPYFLSRVGVVVRLWLGGGLTTRQVVRLAMRVSRFERWGVRPITQARFAALMAAAEAPLPTAPAPEDTRSQLDMVAARLRQVEAEREAAVRAAAEAREALEDTRNLAGRSDARALQMLHRLEAATLRMQHLEGVAAAYRDIVEVSRTVLAERRVRAGVQGFVDAFQHILFERRGTTPQSAAAAALVLGNEPAGDAIATLVNQSETWHGARPFQYLLPFLAPSRPFPLAWPDALPGLRVVDVGSEELDTEQDMHAPLRLVAPVETIGFDPFAASSDAPDAVVEVRRRDGGTIRTYPHLLGDGGVVAFHLNRQSSTSSTLPANHVLTRPFGMLDQSVETVEMRELPTRRLDDVLADKVPVDLLKIDVQGASHTVLAHAGRLLARTLVCHVEAEFVPVYLGERLFGDIDTLMRDAGFVFVDFFNLGRQRYASFEASPARAFHRGRTLWGDCVYVRGLDTPGALTADELFRAAAIMHACYNKQDLAAELLGRSDGLTGGGLRAAYIGAPGTPAA